MTTPTVSTPPAVIATIRAAVEDYLHPLFEYLGDAPYELTEVILADLEAEGWEIVRRPASRLAARSETPRCTRSV